MAQSRVPAEKESFVKQSFITRLLELVCRTRQLLHTENDLFFAEIIVIPLCGVALSPSTRSDLA